MKVLVLFVDVFNSDAMGCRILLSLHYSPQSPDFSCFSFIGRIGGAQDISIGRGCEFKGIVMHEMFHALGRWHEQSRPDRNQFIKINEDNIQSGGQLSVCFCTVER